VSHSEKLRAASSSRWLMEFDLEDEVPFWVVEHDFRALRLRNCCGSDSAAWAEGGVGAGGSLTRGREVFPGRTPWSRCGILAL
jgi:hypothetical protein